MNTRITARTATLALAAILTAGCATQAKVDETTTDADLARGRQQVIDAMDAAWIRVVASGKDRAILAQQPPSNPGAALSYMVTLADCLPQPAIAEFPAKPVGLWKDILERGTIRQVTQKTTNTPNDTSFYFAPISDAYFLAMLDEINAHYNVKLKVEDVALAPGPAPTTSLVVDGKADIVSQLNATGGDTQGMRRRTSRRFTCTLSAISQYMHIPATSPLAGELNTVDDLHSRDGLRICTGPLATQTARAFFPQHKISTRYLNDLTGCARDVEAGKADLIINPLSSLEIGGIKGFKAVNTQIVAGTPLWVALEGIECPSDGNPRTEDQCRAVD
jgi:outer membrane murein-binding lipoprotein Lpp